MAAFRPSAHALKRAVAAFGQERVPILCLNMAAGDVWGTRRKHATRKPVKVRHCVAVRFLVGWFTGLLFNQSHVWLFVLIQLEEHSIKKRLTTFFIRVISSGAWRLFGLRRML